MFEVFLKCLVFRKGFGKGRVFVYKNVVRKKVFILLLDELFFLLEENIEILNFKELIVSVFVEFEFVV